MANLSNINNNFIVTSEGVGRVLIGDTTVPTSALTVSGQQELVKLSRGGATDSKWFFSADSAKLYIAEDTSATANIKLTIIDTGNVGIGTTSPDLTGFGWNVLTVMGGTGTGNAGVLELAAPSADSDGENLGIISFNNASARNAQIAANRESATNNAYLTFWTSPGSGIEERMRIDSVGTIIGTGTYTSSGSIKIFEAQRSGGAVKSDWDYHDSSPIRMSIGTSTSHNFAIKTADTPRLTIDSSGNSSFTGTVKTKNTSVSAYPYFAIEASAKEYHIGVGGASTVSGYANNLYVYDNTAAAIRMVIDTSGNVGIGTDSPDLGAIAGTRVLTIASPTAERWGILELAGNRTWGGNQVGELKFISTDSTNNGTLVSLTAINDPTATGTGGSLKFNTKPNGGSLVERMQIKSNGQVNISQKPNSGLDYDLLINLGTSPDGLIGYQTREQFNNATLQKWYNVDAANSGSSQWVRLGTMSNFAQGGYTFCLTFFGHTGYNASNDQDFNCKLFMKTSNGGGTGPRFNSWVENTGKNQASPAFKWVNTNSSGTPTVGGTSFELYMNVPAYTNGSIYAINKHSGDWTSQNAIGQSDPGADSTTVLQAQNVFNILNTNVGIGTVSPNKALTVYGGNDNGIWIDSQGAQYTSLAFGHNGTEKANIAWDNTNAYTNITTYGSGHLALTTGGGIKAFLNSSGNFGIGDTAPTSLSANTSSLTVNSTRSDLSGAFFQKSNGVIKFQQYWTADGLQSDVAAGNYRWRLANTVKMALVNSTGTLTVVGDIVAYGNPSDKRLKENIKPIESALDKAMKLQGVTFDWKKSDSILKIKEDIGFIAQDVQKVIPELVRENEDGMLSMRHQGIAPILLEAIKEQQEQIKDLRNQINLLKSK